MKAIFTFFVLLLNFAAFAQNIDSEKEKEIIKKTLTEYLDTNPNSLASYLKGNKGYDMMDFAIKMAIVMEEDGIKKQELISDLNQIDDYADSISTILQNKKIKVHIIDTLFAYQYTPVTNDLRNESDWEQAYTYLLEDFKYNNSARLDTIIGEEYIELIKKQINIQRDNEWISPDVFDNSHYEYTSKDTLCESDFCIKADKVYHLVLNKEGNKGCYLFSFYCQDNKICRAFIFIKKENEQWHYVDDYPSWLVDESESFI